MESSGLPSRKLSFLPGPARSVYHELKKGSVYLATGEMRLRLIEGRISAVGKTIVPAEAVVIPPRKQVPLEILSDAFLKVAFGAHARLERIPERTIPAAWDALAERLYTGRQKRLLILGEAGTGKTFLATYLANRLLERSRKVAVVNADTGQSVIGPPGTIAFAILKKQAVLLHEVRPEKLFFTGDYSPAAGFLEFGIGLARLCRQAAAAAETVIVNMPGWVQGEGGRLLSRSAAELVAPDVLVLVERDEELRYMALAAGGWETVQLRTAAAAVKATAAERREIRDYLLQQYFKPARQVVLPFGKVSTDRTFFLTGRKLSLRTVNRGLKGLPVVWAELLGDKEGLFAAVTRPLSDEEEAALRERTGAAGVLAVAAGGDDRRIVALNDAQGEVLALGILESIDHRGARFFIHTPLPPPAKRKVRTVQFGRVRFPDERRTY
jgi:polynucleotide 5'-hydroxyl-kinase GRC3/NOL9